ncbi:hypothetical protein LP419_07910 [Massilia sp. H-1]|nr:hypothetical protein LP419_07910 [Massilia sp. H-1]
MPSTRQTRNAWEVQGSLDVAPKVNLFAKTGSSFRVPTADENGYRASIEVLRIQRSRDLELGARLGDSAGPDGARLPSRAHRRDFL